MQAISQSPRAPLQRSFRTSFSASQKPPGVNLHSNQQQHQRPESPSSPSSNSESSSSDDESGGRQPLRRSQIFKRPPRYQSRKSALSRVDDEDEDGDEEALPFASRVVQKNQTLQRKTSQRNRKDSVSRIQAAHAPRTALSSGPSVTAKGKEREKLRGQGGDASDDIPPQAGRSSSGIVHTPSPKPNIRRPSAVRPPAPESLTSSASSAAAQISRPSSARPPGPLSPRHRAELGRALEHRHTRSGSATGSVTSGGGQGKKEGSEGTPSMGSSFSDLDGKAPLRN